MSAVEDHGQLAAAVDAVFDCGAPTGSGPCVLPAGHDDRCQTMPPVVPLCRLCRGRGQVPGTDDLCWTCQGAGVEP